MALDVYETFLKDLGERLKINLIPDPNNSCVLRMVNGVRLQIELDREGEHIIVGARLGTVPVGSYREGLFRAALITNNAAYPRHGVLAYSRQSKNLVLFERRPLKHTSADEIAEILDPFADKTALWTNAIANGEIPEVPAAGIAPGGMFGIAP